jgi:hypothetical protein
VEPDQTGREDLAKLFDPFLRRHLVGMQRVRAGDRVVVHGHLLLGCVDSFVGRGSRGVCQMNGRMVAPALGAEPSATTSRPSHDLSRSPEQRGKQGLQRPRDPSRAMPRRQLTPQFVRQGYVLGLSGRMAYTNAVPLIDKQNSISVQKPK